MKMILELSEFAGSMNFPEGFYEVTYQVVIV